MSGFLDTNILIYAFTTNGLRTTASLRLLDGTNQIGVQSLNEFANVAFRKLGLDWIEVAAALSRLRALCPPPLPLSIDIHEDGVRLAARYRLALYDAMIVAAALAAGCDTLWSEDMQNGLIVDDRLTILNPFA